MSLSKHLFVDYVGDLFDTRKSFAVPLRAQYRYTFDTISTGKQLRATLRNGPVAWPGGYPLYFITSDGDALSFDTVRRELLTVLRAIANKDNNGWRVVACAVNWEDSELIDGCTGRKIPSAYGKTSNPE